MPSFVLFVDGRVSLSRADGRCLRWPGDYLQGPSFLCPHYRDLAAFPEADAVLGTGADSPCPLPQRVLRVSQGRGLSVTVTVHIWVEGVVTPAFQGKVQFFY